MEWIGLEFLPRLLRDYVPLLAAIAVVATVLGIGHRLLIAGPRAAREGRFVGQLVMLGLTGTGVVIVILALPVDTTTRGQLLSLFGLILSAMIALSSTTFVANAMGGLMLRVLDNFRPGDFVQIDGHFGRVTERGLFHTEIQSEDRDLMTVPNLVLVTNPVRVVRQSGTIVSATLSLGYEVSHATVEPLLERAAADAGLEDAFAQIVELEDHSVVYRVAGFLREVKHILSARSQLRRSVLDTLHAADIEIVSPTFMNQRRVDDRRFVPAASPAPASEQGASSAEALAFDKADRAARIEELRGEITALGEEKAEVEKRVGRGEEAARHHAARRLEAIVRRSASLEAQLERLLERDEDEH